MSSSRNPNSRIYSMENINVLSFLYVFYFKYYTNNWLCLKVSHTRNFSKNKKFLGKQ